MSKDAGMTMPPGGAPPIDDELLSLYLDGALDAADAATVAGALRRDPALVARARETEATVALLRALPQPAPRRTFVLTPEMAASVRPPHAARVVWLSRLVPAMTAASAVAAVLLIALFVGDLRTGGFRTGGERGAANSAGRAITEVASDAATAASSPRPPAAPAPAASGGAAATSPPVSAARAPGNAALPAPTSVAAGSAVAAAGAAIAPAATAGAAPASGVQFPVTLPTATAPPASPTVAAANLPATAAPAPAPAPGGATVAAAPERRVSIALVRTAEIALLLLFLVALGFAVVGIQTRRRV